jgi:glycosyltransferase involved in cell wall biosynthesis
MSFRFNNNRSHKFSTAKVSIGMPVFNSGFKIKKALDSLLNQSFTNFEIIISDNYSKDNTRTICEGYKSKDYRIKYFRQSKNIGAFSNFEFVLNKAKGKYFMWACDDDIWLPKFIENCVKLLEKNKSANIAMTNFKVISRFSSFLNLKFNPNALSFLEIKNRDLRVLEYAKKSFNEHKDNMMFSLWRKNFLKIKFNQMKRLAKRPIAGGPLNDFILFKSHGCLCKEALFIKTYRFMPPGHRFTFFYIRISKIIKFILSSIFNLYTNQNSKFYRNYIKPDYDAKEMSSYLKKILNFYKISRNFRKKFINNYLMSGIKVE